MPSRRRWLLTFITLGLLSASLAIAPRDSEDTLSVTASAQTLEAGGESGMRWYRGNLHTHSLWSDGDDYLESIAAWYRDHDYDFLAFTDHNVLADKERWIDVEKSKGKKLAFDKLKTRFPEWVEERMTEGRLEVRLRRFEEVAERFNEPGKFLLLQGEEVSDSFKGLPIHMNATNVKELVVPRHGDSVLEVMQNNTDALISQRERTGQAMLIHLNHPNFGWAITAEDLMRVRGENFFEVYNGHPSVGNRGDMTRASTGRIWDIVNTFRITELDLPLMYGLATDDGHSYHRIPSGASEPGRGWVMVLASELKPESLIEAMEAGRFYASTGVTMKKIVSSKEGLSVEVAGEKGIKYLIEFVGTRKGFDPKSEPQKDKDGKEIGTTRRYSPQIGAVLARSHGTQATYRFKGDELYVRARIMSTKQHPNPGTAREFEMAWIQPARGPAAP